MLPPVAEALSLIDIASVHREDVHGNAGSVRRAVQILVDHVQYQSVQLSRVEDILAAYGNPTQAGGTVWTKLAAKADLSRLEKLEHQVDSTLSELTAVKARQAEMQHKHDSTAGLVDALKNQIVTPNAQDLARLKLGNK